MHLLIIGIGNPTPSFIKRRLNALVRAGVQLTIVAEYGQSLSDLPTASIIHIGGRLTLMQKLQTFAGVFFRLYSLFRLMSLRPELTFRQKLRWSVKYLALSQVTTPDVVHFQWLAFVPEFQWLRHYFKGVFIASARGSQVTIYPLTRPGDKSRIERAIEKVDYIHCVSNDMALACERRGARKEKLFVNYNGIDLQQFSVRDIAKTSSGFTLISVGSMIWRKGYYYQLQILKKLCDKGHDIQLLWVGDGPDREGLQYTAHVLGILDRVTFEGKVKSTALPYILQQADLYLSTSIAEGLANSVVEASACGLPVVSFACEGMEEILEQDKNGFILPFGDVDGVVDKIAYLIDHSTERKKMGACGRAIAEEKFNEQEWVERMIKTCGDLGKK